MERIAKKRHLPFLTAYAKAKQRYAIEMKTDEFIETAYDVWRSIGNIASTSRRFFATVPDDYVVELPGNVEFIESVTLIEGQPQLTNYDSGGEKDRHTTAMSTVENIPKSNQSIRTSLGSSVNYTLAGSNAVKITSADLLNTDIMIVYNVLDLDADNLPLLNDKEVAAIASEVARRVLIRRIFQGVGPKANNALESLLTIVTNEADRLMAAAKIDEKITDDAIDKLLDIKTSWDRKVYGSRFRMIN